VKWHPSKAYTGDLPAASLHSATRFEEEPLLTPGACVGDDGDGGHGRLVLEERQDRELANTLQEKGLLGFHRLSRAETQRVADALKESGLPATLDQAICYRNYIKANNEMSNRGKIHAFIRGPDGCVLRTPAHTIPQPPPPPRPLSPPPFPAHRGHCNVNCKHGV